MKQSIIIVTVLFVTLGSVRFGLDKPINYDSALNITRCSPEVGKYQPTRPLPTPVAVALAKQIDQQLPLATVNRYAGAIPRASYRPDSPLPVPTPVAVELAERINEQLPLATVASKTFTTNQLQ